jgi:hypothetical protein
MVMRRVERARWTRPRSAWTAAVAGGVAALGVLALVAAGCGEQLPLPNAGPDAAAGADQAAPDQSDAAGASDALADASLDAALDASSDALASDADSSGGACDVRLASPPVVASPHVPEGTPVAYTSNPPSSGPHYPVWANFQEFTHPIDDGYLVHSMEHGAVLLLYKCDDDPSACPAMAAALRAVRDAVPTDPICDPTIRVRVVIAPRPANDVPIAAAAWGQTYRADCVDPASLAAFIAAHYGQGPEVLCAPGSSTL